MQKVSINVPGTCTCIRPHKCEMDSENWSGNTCEFIFVLIRFFHMDSVTRFYSSSFFAPGNFLRAIFSSPYFSSPFVMATKLYMSATSMSIAIRNLLFCGRCKKFGALTTFSTG